MDSSHRYALIEYMNKLKRQRAEIDSRLDAVNFLLSEETLLNDIPDTQNRLGGVDFKKQENEQWVDYVLRLLQGLGEAKTNDIVRKILEYNPSIERNEDTLRKTVNRCWRELREDQRISIIEGKSPKEGNTYFFKNK